MSASGIGTLDVNAIVQQLMQRERYKVDKLEKAKEHQQASISVYGQLNTLINTFNTNMASVGSAFQASNYTVNSSNPAVTGSATTATGTHTIVVSAIAQSEVLSSNVTFASNSTALNANETLNFSVGSQPGFSVVLAPTDTLQNVRDKINNTAGNDNTIKASIIASTDQFGNPQYNLIVSSGLTGAANTISVSGDTSNIFDLTNITTVAQDANFTFDGYTVVRPTNNITDVLDGLTFTLNSPPPLSQTLTAILTIDSSNQTSITNVTTAMNAMVTSYNALISFIDTTQADPDTHDDTLPLVKLALQNAMNSRFTVSGNYHSLADLGIILSPAQDQVLVKKIRTKEYGADGQPKIGPDGREMFKETKREIHYKTSGQITVNADPKSSLPQFATQLANDFVSSGILFNDPTNGVVNIVDNKAIDDVQTGIMSPTGVITIRSNSINQVLYNINHKIETEEDRLKTVQVSLVKKYSALNGLLSKFARSNSFLQGQLSRFAHDKE